jgi:hypothetical protein
MLYERSSVMIKLGKVSVETRGSKVAGWPEDSGWPQFLG